MLLECVSHFHNTGKRELAYGYSCLGVGIVNLIMCIHLWFNEKVSVIEGSFTRVEREISEPESLVF